MTWAATSSTSSCLSLSDPSPAMPDSDGHLLSCTPTTSVHITIPPSTIVQLHVHSHNTDGTDTLNRSKRHSLESLHSRPRSCMFRAANLVACLARRSHGTARAVEAGDAQSAKTVT